MMKPFSKTVADLQFLAGLDRHGNVVWHSPETGTIHQMTAAEKAEAEKIDLWLYTPPKSSKERFEELNAEYNESLGEYNRRLFHR